VESASAAGQAELAAPNIADVQYYLSDLLERCAAQTQGRGYFRFRFERYEEAPMNVAQKVIEQYKEAEEE